MVDVRVACRGLTGHTDLSLETVVVDPLRGLLWQNSLLSGRRGNALGPMDLDVDDAGDRNRAGAWWRSPGCNGCLWRERDAAALAYAHGFEFDPQASSMTCLRLSPQPCIDTRSHPAPRRCGCPPSLRACPDRLATIAGSTARPHASGSPDRHRRRAPRHVHDLASTTRLPFFPSINPLVPAVRLLSNAVRRAYQQTRASRG